MKTKYGQKGFTLIELITVIVILALLAVFAIPRYLDALTAARKSLILGIEGSVQSAVALVKAKAKLQGLERGDAAGAATVTLEKGEGGTVAVAITKELFPEGLNAGIGAAIDLRDTQASITVTPDTVAGPPNIKEWRSTNAPTPATCRVRYTEAADGAVTIGTVLDGC